MSDDLVPWFRRVALYEGISFLVLLGVAMPLKYLAGMPLAVSVAGMTHGVLFILYAVMIGLFVQRSAWSLGRAAEVLVLGVVPFGFLAVERRLRPRVARP